MTNKYKFAANEACRVEQFAEFANEVLLRLEALEKNTGHTQAPKPPTSTATTRRWPQT